MKKTKIAILALVLSIFFGGCSITNQFQRQYEKVAGAPEVTSISPKNNSSDVPLDAVIEIVFSEDMDPGTLNAKGVTVSYTNKDLIVFINPLLNSTYEYNESDRRLTITPPQNFVPDEEVEVILTDTVKSSDNKSLPKGTDMNGMQSYRYTFTTSKVEGELSNNRRQESENDEAGVEISEDQARQIALDFITNSSETFKFDGKVETLQVVTSKKVGCQGCYDVVATFTSKNQGYGNRTGSTTPIVSGDAFHEVLVSIIGGEVAEAVMDEEWDVVKQEKVE